ncbi:MAG: 3-keto-5-aminohexanoate cleavage protein [Proteobacteria bacterium]|nr:3-keto-5-aminohexanoate cleavage protein [Pseudomonadota bacterium]
MQNEVFITCAVTGSGSTYDKHPAIPTSPEQIANAAIEAANAGAAIAHIHVRDPETGVPSRKVEYYEEVCQRVRDAGTDVVLNLTAGMGGDMVFGQGEELLPLAEGTDMAGPLERLLHVESCLPEICTLDCGTMNFAEANYVMTNTPAVLNAMARRVQELGVRPKLEVFDSGHLVYVKKMIELGLLDNPIMIQLCMGIPYGAPDDLNTFMGLVNNLPLNSIFSAFSIGRRELPFIASALAAGGNIRVGLEDNLFLEKGVYASNGALVERAVTIARAMNVKLLSPAEVREKLQLKGQR